MVHVHVHVHVYACTIMYVVYVCRDATSVEDETSPVSDIPFVDETEQAKQPTPPAQGREGEGSTLERDMERRVEGERQAESLQREEERGREGEGERGREGEEERGREGVGERGGEEGEVKSLEEQVVAKIGEEEGEVSSQSSTPSPRPKGITPRCYMDAEEPKKRNDKDNQDQYVVHCTCTPVCRHLHI